MSWKRTIPVLAAALLPALPAIAELTARTGGDGRTVLEIKCPETHCHNIFRSVSPISAGSAGAAQCIAVRLAPEQRQFVYTVSGSGKYYYALGSCNADGSGAKLEYVLPEALDERDVTAPGAPELRGTYRDGAAVLEWNSPPLRNPERISGFRLYRETGGRVERIAELHPVRDWVQQYEDRNFGENARYFLTALDSSGNESVRSLPFVALPLADLMIGG